MAPSSIALIETLQWARQQIGHELRLPRGFLFAGSSARGNMQLKSLTTNSGYLEECRVEFASGLTCIIGARGTCKSTIIETLRFIFGIDPDRIDDLIAKEKLESGVPAAASHGLLRETLGAGSARSEVLQDGFSYVLERELDAATRIYVDGVREHSDTDLLRQIEIFSQGDLQRIADDDRRRLDLIDRGNRSLVERAKRERTTYAARLQQIGLQLRSLRTEITQARAELAPHTQIAQQLQEIVKESPLMSPELDEKRVAFEKRERALDAMGDADELRVEFLTSIRPLRSIPERFRALLDRLVQQRQPTTAPAEALLTQIASDAAKLLALADNIASADIVSLRQHLAAAFEQENEHYFQLRQHQQEANESLKKQTALRRQLDLMEKRARDLDRLAADESRLLKERADFRAKISAIDDEVYQFRINEIEAINNDHGQTILLALENSGISREYIDTLCALLGGSRIRNQDEIAVSIAKTFGPSALIDIVESGNAQRLADVLGRDLGQMNRVVTYLSDSPDLYRLEADPPAVRLDITMFHDGEPKPVETLSKGQKATALLPLLLRPHAYPLIIDQPEDDLDNKFIFRVLITQLKTLKRRRQVIFVTHNANIPVLGEADEVIVMSMQTPKRASPPLVGTVDERKGEILDLLEGGAEAFRLRESSYGDLLL
jgi:DNA repair ATPase RecN